jgi:hypothetical protein
VEGFIRYVPWSNIICIYVDDIRTSQVTRLLAPTACYRDSFTFLYVDDVRTSQETCLWVSIACCGDIFAFLLTSSAYRKANISPQQAMETHRQVSCEVRMSSTYKKVKLSR